MLILCIDWLLSCNTFYYINRCKMEKFKPTLTANLESWQLELSAIMVKSALVVLGLVFFIGLCLVRARIDDACDPDYEYPPSSENECPIPIPCGFGVCRVSSTQVFYCDCDLHAYGSNCLQVCCKDCGEFGRCVRNLSNVEVCECSPDYTGEFCDTLMSWDEETGYTTLISKKLKH